MAITDHNFRVISTNFEETLKTVTPFSSFQFSSACACEGPFDPLGRAGKFPVLTPVFILAQQNLLVNSNLD